MKDVLRWTEELPTDPGTYWCYRPTYKGVGWRIVKLSLRNGALESDIYMGRYLQPTDFEPGTRWAGPIAKPKPLLKRK